MFTKVILENNIFVADHVCEYMFLSPFAQGYKTESENCAKYNINSS